MSDNNYRSFYDTDGPLQLTFGELYPSEDWVRLNGLPDDVLKITSRAKDITVRGKKIIGGKEDCLDVNNHAEDIFVHFDEWQSGGRYVCTIKGGSKRIKLSGKITKHGKFTDVAIGEFSNQGNDPTGPVELAMTADGPVKVFLANGPDPIFVNGNTQDYDVWDVRWAWPVYLWIKKLFPGLRI